MFLMEVQRVSCDIITEFLTIIWLNSKPESFIQFRPVFFLFKITKYDELQPKPMMNLMHKF
jgi:hypothetical protein